MASPTNEEDRWEGFSVDELSILRECVHNWRMEDLGIGATTLKLEQEIMLELEKRSGIIHA